MTLTIVETRAVTGGVDTHADVHVAAALVTIGLFIIHLYMGLAVVPGSLTAIVRGEVTPQWAKKAKRPDVCPVFRVIKMLRPLTA